MKLGESIIDELIKDKDVVSATIVGSYSEKKDISKIGDLDVVVICKSLSKKIFLKIVKKLNKKKFRNKFLINSSFGPLKIGLKKSLPLHLMIYDINSHKEHVINSPFTCFDWERSKMYRGISLKQIYPVERLQLNDFFNSRRNSEEYLNDLKRNKISIRRYLFKGNKIILEKKHVKIDPRNRGEFVYHVINFLVINLYKFIKDKNIKVKGKKYEKLFQDFQFIKKQKINKNFNYDFSTISLAIKFISKYNKYLSQITKDSTQIDFVRHAKTPSNKRNTFLGIRQDPLILKLKKNKNKKKIYDYIITSQLKRSQLSANFFLSKKIIKEPLVNEIDYGKADGLTYESLKKKYPKIIKSWNNGNDIRFPEGENSSDLKKRIHKFLNKVQKFKKGSKLLVISHSFFLRVLLALVIKCNIKKAYKIKIKHLKVYEFLQKENKIFPNFNRLEFNKIRNQIHD